MKEIESYSINARRTCDEEKRAEIVIKLIGKVKGKKILDVGCGLGTCMRMLNFRGAKTTGLDISPVRSNLNIKQFDLNSGSLPFKNKVFDIVICTEVLEHVFYSRFILMEIKRVLKDKGIAIISMPNDYVIVNRWLLLLGKPITHHEIDTFGNHYITNIEQVKEFIEKEFIITEHDFEWYTGKKVKYLLFLKNLYPNLFAQNIIMRCKK